MMIELSSFTEALMSDLSCTSTLVTFGWLHTWEIESDPDPGIKEDLGSQQLENVVWQKIIYAN